MAKRSRKPAPVESQETGLKGYARRGPREDGRWYWQFGHWVDRKWAGVPNTAAWLTKDEAQRIVLGLKIYKPTPLGPSRTMGSLLLRWLAHQESRLANGSRPGTLSDKSYDVYLREVDRLHPLIGDVLVARFGQLQMERLRDRLSEQGLSGKTVQLILSVVRMAWLAGLERGWGPTQRLPRVSLPDLTPKRNVRCPTQEEAAAVFHQLPGWETDPRVRLVYLLIWYTGARVMEAASIRWSDLDLNQGQVTLHRKGRRGTKLSATLDLHKDLLHNLQVLAEGTEHQRGFLLPSSSPNATQQALRREINKACAAAKVQRFTPHGLRRLASTILIEANTSQKVYETIMGHSWQMGLKTYAKARRPAQQSAVALLGPGELNVVHLPKRAGKQDG